MNVTLAGYNIDSSIIEELKNRAGWTEDNVTPETLSAAYARISRDPADIGELRKISRTEVAKSRKSNETIIFGLGHSSVAEHAVFNFDIVGLSRLATEEVQKFRLASFTEKSQRYITLDGDFVMPQELEGTKYAEKFAEMIKLQNDAYFTLFEALKEDLFAKNADKIKTKRDKIDLETKAKEDARYIVGLATKSQFGMLSVWLPSVCSTPRKFILLSRPLRWRTRKASSRRLESRSRLTCRLPCSRWKFS